MLRHFFESACGSLDLSIVTRKVSSVSHCLRVTRTSFHHSFRLERELEEEIIIVSFDIHFYVQKLMGFRHSRSSLGKPPPSLMVKMSNGFANNPSLASVAPTCAIALLLRCAS